MFGWPSSCALARGAYYSLMHGWKEPDFVEIKMDAEIGSYQEDYDPLGDEPRPLANPAAKEIAETNTANA